MEQIKYVEDQLLGKNNYPKFRSGDNIEVDYRIVEGEKSRIQTFRGNVLQVSGHGLNKTFTVRKISSGIGVERIFPFSSPHIDEIRILKKGHVRRAKLYYIRKHLGKKTKIREKSHFA